MFFFKAWIYNVKMAKKKKSVIPKSSEEYKELIKLRKKLKEAIKMLEDAKKEVDKKQNLIITNPDLVINTEKG